MTRILGGSTTKWASMITAYDNFQSVGVVVFANGNDYNSSDAGIQAGLPVVATELADAWLIVGNLNINRLISAANKPILAMHVARQPNSVFSGWHGHLVKHW